MPMAALATRMRPNVSSWIGPTIRITTSKAPRMALKRVKMLARTISPIVRLVRSPVSLTAPFSTRSRTSWPVSPASGVSTSGASSAGSAVTSDVLGAVIASSRSRLHRHQRDLAGGVVLQDPEPTELGQPVTALVGTDRDQLVARLQQHRPPRPVEVAAGTADGEQVVPGFELELGLGECASVEERARRH